MRYLAGLLLFGVLFDIFLLGWAIGSSNGKPLRDKRGRFAKR